MSTNNGSMTLSMEPVDLRVVSGVAGIEYAPLDLTTTKQSPATSCQCAPPAANTMIPGAHPHSSTRWTGQSLPGVQSILGVTARESPRLYDTPRYHPYGYTENAHHGSQFVANQDQNYERERTWTDTYADMWNSWYGRTYAQNSGGYMCANPSLTQQYTYNGFPSPTKIQKDNDVTPDTCLEYENDNNQAVVANMKHFAGGMMVLNTEPQKSDPKIDCLPPLVVTGYSRETCAESSDYCDGLSDFQDLKWRDTKQLLEYADAETTSKLDVESDQIPFSVAKRCSPQDYTELHTCSSLFREIDQIASQYNPAESTKNHPEHLDRLEKKTSLTKTQMISNCDITRFSPSKVKCMDTTHSGESSMGLNDGMCISEDRKPILAIKTPNPPQKISRAEIPIVNL